MIRLLLALVQAPFDVELLDEHQKRVRRMSFTSTGMRREVRLTSGFPLSNRALRTRARDSEFLINIYYIIPSFFIKKLGASFFRAFGSATSLSAFVFLNFALFMVESERKKHLCLNSIGISCFSSSIWSLQSRKGN